LKQIFRAFKVDDPNLRYLNYIFVDIDLKIEKIEILSNDDVELLKAIQAEEQDNNRSPEKTKAIK
jgi:hypothetical protein